MSLPSLTVGGGHLKFYEVSKQECTCPYMFQAEFSSPLLEGGSICNKGSPGGSAVKNPPANAGDTADVGSMPGSGRRSPGEGNAAHSSILAWEIPWRGDWRATACGVAESDTTEHACLQIFFFSIINSNF